MNQNTQSKKLFFYVIFIAVFLYKPAIGFSFACPTDSIAPVIVKQAQNENVACGLVEPISALESWYNFAGAMSATDNLTASGDITYIGEPSLQEAIVLFNENTICGESRRVTVTFYAVDTCNNRSAPSVATFSLVDDRGPEIFRNAQPKTLRCDSNSSDSLKVWLQDHGNAIADDLCGGVQWLRFAYSDNQGNSGTGFLNNDTIPIPGQICNWRVTVSFIAIDDCGNQSVTTSNFTLFDSFDPEFNILPDDVTVSCEQLEEGFGVIGIDNCTRNPIMTVIDTSTQSSDPADCEYYNYSILRTYVVEDACGNTASHQHMIEVLDTVRPTFEQPIDTLVDCSVIGSSDSDLFPANISDNCSDVTIVFNDSIVGGGCAYSIIRSYTISDVCGNSSTAVHTISVIDTTPPEIFGGNLDYIVNCTSSSLLTFDEFLLRPQELVSNDNCSEVEFFVATPGSYIATDTSTFPGTRPSLEFDNCGLARPGYILYKEVDVVFYDECGNTTIIEAVYGIEDNEAPIILSCFSDTTVVADTSNCTGIFTLPEIITEDNCVIFRDNIELFGSADFIPLDANNPESPVRTLVVELGDFSPFFLDIQENAILEVTINSGDINDSDEFFTIISENGDSLGITPLSTIECGSASAIYSIPAETAARWAEDGLIRFLFIQTGERTINYICGGGGIEVKLTIQNEAVQNRNITLLDGIPLSEDDYIDVNTILIPPGTHTITQIVEDCAGNRDSCSYKVTTLDTIAPIITCPEDLVILGESVDCNIDVKIPLDLVISDNCILNGSFSQTLPLPENSLLFYSSPGGGLAFEAEEVNVAFTNVQPIRFSDLPAKLVVEIQADINDVNELFEVLGENNTFLGFLGGTGGGECTRYRKEFIISQELFNEWSSDGIIEFRFDPLSSSDGINPCNELLEDGTDGSSFLRATLAYSDAILEYKIEGVDTIARQELPMGADSIDLSVSSSVNLVTIYAKDQSGNSDSCSFMVTVRDNMPPVARCKQTVMFLDPAGIDDLIVLPENIDGGSTDNCSIDSMLVSPNAFTCDDVGTEIDVMLYVYDESANVDSCSTQVAIRAPILEPYFELDVCTNDTLRLFANVPPPPIPNAYTFRWSGPFFSSFSENPVIANVSGTNNGTYMLEVVGFNGCVSSGTVDVNITEIISPTITTQQSEVCRGESLLLATNGLSGNVTYNWYQGIYPNGLLLEKTESPSYLITPVEKESFYYLIIEQNGCESNPSAGKKIDLIDAPQVSVLDEFISVCEGEFISFGTNVFGGNYEYFWFGPNQFTSGKQFPDTIFNVSKANEGTYSLYISVGNCLSDTTNLLVTVFEKPLTPVITANEVFCEGSSIGLTINNIPNGDEYIWYLNGMEYTTTATNSLIIPDVTAALSGNWSAEVSDGICMSDRSESVVISVESELIISANNSGPGCSGDSIDLLTSFVPDATYSWVGPNGFMSDVQNPRIPANPGEYTITIVTENGCIAEASTTVSVVNPAEITALSSNAEDCVDGTSTISFFPSIFPAGNYIYQWTGPNGFTSNLLNPIINNVNSSINGKYTLVVVSGACRSLPRSIDINVTDIPPKPIISGDINYCQGDDVILSTQLVANATNYIWSTPQGQRFTNVPELIISSIEEQDAGAYTVSIQAGNCRSVLSDPLNINIDNLAFDPIISYNGPLCPGDTLRLESTFLNGVQYAWQGPDNFISNEQNPIIPNVAESLSGNFLLTVSLGSCTKTSSPLMVEIIPSLGPPAIETPNQTYCRTSIPDQLDLCLSSSAAVNGAEYVLYSGMDNSEISRSENICQTITNLDDLTSGESLFFFRIDQAGCLSAASEMISITISDPPIIDAEIDESNLVFCNDDPVSLTSSFGPPEITLEWSPVSSNLTTQVTGDRTVNVSNLVPGNNELVLTYSTDQCPDFTSATIVIVKEQSSDLRNDIFTLTDFNEVLLSIFSNDNLSENYTYQVIQQPIAGSVVLEDGGARFVPDIRFAGTTSFIYEVCDLNCGGDCQQATVLLNIGDSGDCTSPTIITPNGDGYNDYFVIPCLSSGNYSGNKLTIFNQWGVSILEKENYQNDWAGTYNGDDLPVGTYFYILDLGDNSDPIIGFLTLER